MIKNLSNPINNILKKDCTKILYGINSLLQGLDDYNEVIDYIIDNNLFSTLHKDHRKLLIKIMNKINVNKAELKIIQKLYKEAKPLEENSPTIIRS